MEQPNTDFDNWLKINATKYSNHYCLNSDKWGRKRTIEELREIFKTTVKTEK